MLGLLVFPREGFIDQIPSTLLTDLAAAGWPVPKVVGDFRQAEDLRELVRYLRNAIAHFNIEFIGDASNEIRILKVWNTSRGRQRLAWKNFALSRSASQISCWRMVVQQSDEPDAGFAGNSTGQDHLGHTTGTTCLL